MGFQPVVIDGSITRIGGGSVYVHEGYYLLKVTNNSLSAVDHKSVWPFITWNLRIEDGLEGIGRTYNHTTTLMPDQQWALGGLVNAVGQDPSVLAGIQLPTYEAAQQLTGQLLSVAKDKSFVAMIADGQPGPQGQKSCDIKQVFPAADWETLKKNNERFAAIMANPQPAAAFAPSMLPASPFGAPAPVGPAPSVTPELQGAVANVFAQNPVLNTPVQAPLSPFGQPAL